MANRPPTPPSHRRRPRTARARPSPAAPFPTRRNSLRGLGFMLPGLAIRWCEKAEPWPCLSQFSGTVQ